MTIVMSEISLDTLAITKSRLEIDSVKLLLSSTIGTRQTSLRCLDLSQNYIFADNILHEHKENVRYLIFEGSKFAQFRYLETNWDKQLYSLTASEEAQSALFFKTSQDKKTVKVSISN